MNLLVVVRASVELRPGDPVMTPGGAGRVVCIRMAPPDYDRPDAVSVLLDERRDRAGYRGTVYPFAEVRRLVN